MQTALVCGGGGFIGRHLVKRLIKEGFGVRSVDLKSPEFSQTEADDFVIADLHHNIFGDEGTWVGGREKAPAAICRKVAQALDGSAIEIWGDGEQTRSFLYIDECLEGTVRLIRANFTGPVNIGSEEMVSINQLADMIIKISGKKLDKTYIDGPIGVRGRNSDNKLIQEKLGWKPTQPMENRIKKNLCMD